MRFIKEAVVGVVFSGTGTLSVTSSSQKSAVRIQNKFPILTPELTLRSHDYAWALPHTAVCILNTLTHVTPLVCSRSAGGWLAENFNVRRSFFGNFKLDDGRRVKGPADSRRPALLV